MTFTWFVRIITETGVRDLYALVMLKVNSLTLRLRAVCYSLAEPHEQNLHMSGLELTRNIGEEIVKHDVFKQLQNLQVRDAATLPRGSFCVGERVTLPICPLPVRKSSLTPKTDAAGEIKCSLFSKQVLHSIVLLTDRVKRSHGSVRASLMYTLRQMSRYG